MAARISASGESMTRTANVPAQATFTFTAWAYVVNDRSTQWRFLFSLDNVSDYYILGWSTTNDYFVASSAGDGTSFNPNNPPTAGNGWFYTALNGNGDAWWVDITNNTVYSQVDATVPGSIVGATMYLGSDGWNEWADIRMAAVKIWDANLTEAEILAEMWTYLPQRTANLNGFWPMFPGATERLRDYGGNVRNLTENGTLSDEDGPPLSWGAEPLFSQFVTAAPVTNLPIMVSKMHPSKNVLLRL